MKTEIKGYTVEINQVQDGNGRLCFAVQCSTGTTPADMDKVESSYISGKGAVTMIESFGIPRYVVAALVDLARLEETWTTDPEYPQVQEVAS